MFLRRERKSPPAARAKSVKIKDKVISLLGFDQVNDEDIDMFGSRKIKVCAINDSHSLTSLSPPTPSSTRPRTAPSHCQNDHRKRAGHDPSSGVEDYVAERSLSYASLRSACSSYSKNTLVELPASQKFSRPTSTTPPPKSAGSVYDVQPYSVCRSPGSSMLQSGHVEEDSLVLVCSPRSEGLSTGYQRFDFLRDSYIHQEIPGLAPDDPDPGSSDMIREPSALDNSSSPLRPNSSTQQCEPSHPATTSIDAVLAEYTNTRGPPSPGAPPDVPLPPLPTRVDRVADSPLSLCQTDAHMRPTKARAHTPASEMDGIPRTDSPILTPSIRVEERNTNTPSPVSSLGDGYFARDSDAESLGLDGDCVRRALQSLSSEFSRVAEQKDRGHLFQVTITFVYNPVTQQYLPST